MGSESYYIYIDASNREITSEDLGTFDGKKIGVNKDSFQENLLKEWAEKNHLTINIVELMDDEAYSMDMLSQGELDALVTMAPERQKLS